MPVCRSADSFLVGKRDCQRAMCAFVCFSLVTDCSLCLGSVWKIFLLSVFGALLALGRSHISARYCSRFPYTGLSFLVTFLRFKRLWHHYAVVQHHLLSVTAGVLPVFTYQHVCFTYR